MLLFYRFVIAGYYFLILLSSPFNQKAKLWIRGRKNIFNRIKASVNPNDKTAWFHCASLGEFEQGRPLIEAFREKYPGHKILLTFYSPSGYEVRKNYEKADYIFYLPLDTPVNAKRFLNIVNPEIVFFIKYEFWYYLIKETGKRGIPLYLVSGIFREKQLFFKWYGKPFRLMLENFTHFFVQNKTSEKLLKSVGINNTTITGDTRFDRVFSIAQQSKILPLAERFKQNNRVLILGSSWQPDEEIVLTYYNQNKNLFKLIIAPHEIENENINRIIKSVLPGKKVLKYSEANESNIELADILIIDSIGLLSSLYKYGDIAYIGGGFGKGIHNILEAATFGLPVVFGPNYKKFQEAVDLIEQGGAFTISDYTDFKNILDNTLSNPEKLKRTGKVSSDYVEYNKGATFKILNTLRIA
ncbi:MAG: 3-deoxy-D-manno-octulosonic acid transferase [Bacteroidetes bacterium GWC2_33_15]|nr:MAG: 3-deoxy-D-manno-octulosonic acid transferase [Bacteroidetes bacterium GWA2_33_15]OFX49387.1 MAG: 3-deoxy-D-manno-octulosonic acid transferase [Bacteroidetes bacterium GWC2_33_15]OFX63020.1 MAG: 3-deoxy-D-manno-octulosonic acid transferase [Bacteroidetes bacterium GWB2_32_14]OFX68735.1 MAG: 3-deoxy-D-manno-octulosonic acid transferase [Bacteroidetes bacterium GWD2_33_33]HAN19093.1 3-deoxy-D-manno-octulosonic acid transferase [Bacteroidales bacterium]